LQFITIKILRNHNIKKYTIIEITKIEMTVSKKIYSTCWLLLSDQRN